MELFDKKFVHFMWDDELEGKKCFVGGDIDILRAIVEKGVESDLHSIVFSRNESAPFRMADGSYNWQFAYYDPNYAVKKAFNTGKVIQYKCGKTWVNITSEQVLTTKLPENWELRVKPEKDENFIAYLSRGCSNFIQLCVCRECDWKTTQKLCNARTKLHVGAAEDCLNWIQSRAKFTEVIKAWEDGKTIQLFDGVANKWVDCDESPKWQNHCTYRVKPDCPCEDGINSKACAGCPQDEERKQTFRPFKDCDELVEFWSKNYQTGFRPAYTKPLIWVRLKCDKRERLIVAFGTDFVEIGNKAKAVPLQKLFNDYEFLDVKPCGVEEK